ncbi:AraC family transcriptional regulator [Pseudomonas sp. NPDC087358]|uniref:AraC family transcriptional regulator n=1 Tax=Pseudomonas sp. NPDC087358 TaxID=3364439 RepID=UPI00384CE9AA
MEALGMDYRHGEWIGRHCHAEDQLIYATQGVMQVRTERGNWIIPSGHALWVPAGVGHEIRMSGDVCMRTLLLPAQERPCQVIEVPALLRELILAAQRLLIPDSTPLAGHLRALVLHELVNARRVVSHIPMPRLPRLLQLCERFLDDPAQDLSLDECGVRLNMSARTVARLFQRELGMTFAEWRTHARMILSQQRLTDGAPILHVALEHGYQSASAFAAVFKRVLGYTPRACRAGRHEVPGPAAVH